MKPLFNSVAFTSLSDFISFRDPKHISVREGLLHITAWQSRRLAESKLLLFSLSRYSLSTCAKWLIVNVRDYFYIIHKLENRWTQWCHSKQSWHYRKFLISHNRKQSLDHWWKDIDQNGVRDLALRWSTTREISKKNAIFRVSVYQNEMG